MGVGYRRVVGVCGDVDAHQDSLDEREEFIALIRLHTARRLGATQRSGRRENIDCQKYHPVMFETALTQHLTPRAVGRVCPEMSTPEVSAGYEDDGSFVIRVILPGVESKKEVDAAVVDEPKDGTSRLEITVPSKYELSHPLPFAVPDWMAYGVKFAKKTSTLCVTFERIDETRVPGLEHFNDNDALYLAQHPTKGRHVRARRDIEPGETILTCAPFVHVVHDRRAGDHCAGCFKDLSRMGNETECVECGEFCGVKYCDEDCRAADTSHVAECSMVRTNAGTGADLRGVRMCLRMIHKRADEPTRFAKVMAALRCEKKSVSAAATKLAAAVRHQTDLGPAEVEDMLGKTRENSHGIVDWKLRQVGTGIYPEASMFNHSCAPNAVVSFAPGGTLNVQCIGVDDYVARADDVSANAEYEWMHMERPVRPPRSIKKGEEVCIAYTELYRPAESRKTTLEKSKGFTCECVRCVNPSVLRAMDRELHAAIDGKEDLVEENVKEWEESIDASRAAYTAGNILEAIKSAEKVLRSSADVLRDGHFLRLEARLAAIEARVELACQCYEKDESREDIIGDWLKVFELCVPTLRHMRTHLPFYHPGTVAITQHLALALTELSAFSPDPDDYDRTDAMEDAQTQIMSMNALNAIFTIRMVQKKLNGVKDGEPTASCGLNAPTKDLHFLKRLGRGLEITARMTQITALASVMEGVRFIDKVSVPFAFMDGSLSRFPAFPLSQSLSRSTQ